MENQQAIAQDRSTEFVAVSGGEDATSAAQLLVTAYILMWACALFLIYRSLKSQRQVTRRIDKLEETLALHDAQLAEREGHSPL
jgi:hypothetical protein